MTPNGEKPATETISQPASETSSFGGALRNFGITALRGSPRSNGARPPRDTG